MKRLIYMTCYTDHPTETTYFECYDKDNRKISAYELVLEHGIDISNAIKGDLNN